MTRSLGADLAELERTDPVVAKAAASYDRLVVELAAKFRAEPLTDEQFDRARLVAIGCAGEDRLAGRTWSCRCAWCGVARKGIAERAVRRSELEAGAGA